MYVLILFRNFIFISTVDSVICLRHITERLKKAVLNLIVHTINPALIMLHRAKTETGQLISLAN